MPLFTAKERITVHRDGKPCYDIVYSSDLACLTAELDKIGLLKRRCAIITDTNVAPLYEEQVRRALEQASGAVPAVYIVPAGEEHKTLGEIEKLYRFLIEQHFDRSSYLVALGGGVIGDMTGYAAATYLRGIDFVQIPTTLLAQADSSIGGKTGVDLVGYKNMVGAFHMPRLVFASCAFLSSLDERQFLSGFAEVIKHGLIRDSAYYDWLIAHREEILARDEAVLSLMLQRSNEIKRDVVEKDPLEKGERMLLNFGHTVGHAIEKYSDFQMLHGECVSLGCIAAAFLSAQRNELPDEEVRRIRSDFSSFGLPVSCEIGDESAVVQLTKSDKKMKEGQIRFILLHEIGDAYVDQTITSDELQSAVHAVQKQS